MSQAKNEQRGWFEAIKPLKSTFAGGGTHVNVSAAAIAKNAPNKDNALKLMELLSAGTAQKIYAEQVYEYPVLPGAEPSEVVKSFGTLKPDALPLVDIAANRKKASELVDKVGYNDGPSQ